jgi:predicted transcriptional regulator
MREGIEDEEEIRKNTWDKGGKDEERKKTGRNEEVTVKERWARDDSWKNERRNKRRRGNEKGSRGRGA